MKITFFTTQPCDHQFFTLPHLVTIEGLNGSLGIEWLRRIENLFFQNLSEKIIYDNVIPRRLNFPNVMITDTRGFFTKEALDQIAETTLSNIQHFIEQKPLENSVSHS